MGEVTVAFDLDGTLIDSAPDIHAIANTVLDGEGVAPITMAQTRDFVGNGAAHFVMRLREARGIGENEQDRMLAAFMALYDGAVDLTTLYPGVSEALAALHTAGHRLALCTNKPEAPTRTVLGHFGLDTRFEVVVGGDTLPVKKPDPAPLLETFTRAGAGPRRVFVGDSEIDADCAARAGVPFLLFTEGYRKAPLDSLTRAASFDDFAALPGLVAALAD